MHARHVPNILEATGSDPKKISTRVTPPQILYSIKDPIVAKRLERQTRET